MNIIDVFLIIIILLSVWSGFQRGFITAVAEFISMIATLYIVFLFYPALARFIERNSGSAGFVSFGLALILSILVVRLLIAVIMNYALAWIPPKAYNHKSNKALGVIPGLLNGVIYSIILSGLLLMTPFSPSISAKTHDSKLANKFSNVLDSLEKKIPDGVMDSIHNSLSKMTIETGSTKFVKLGYIVKSPTVRPDLETKMLGMVNEERKKEGLKPLVADPELTKVARKHSVDMFAKGYFSHHSPEKRSLFDRIREAHLTYRIAGENLALAPSLAMAHQGLMKSPGHRENIMRPAFGRLGIGIMDGGRFGLMVTQNFRN